MIRVPFLLLFWTIVCVLSSCKTTRITSGIQRDTIVSLKPVAIPYDTALKLKGDTARRFIPIPCISPQVSLDTQDVQVGNTIVKAAIKDGKLFIGVQQKDTTVKVHGIAHGLVADTTVNTTKTVTIVKSLSWWGELWLKIKGAGTLLLIILFLILLLIAIQYFQK